MKDISNNGYVMIRNGILDHLRTGRISTLHFTILYIMTKQAQYDTGLWIGSPKRLHGDIPTESEHAIRMALRHLGKLGWVRGWSIEGDAKAKSHYLLNKFEATSGRHKGDRLNLSKTETWDKPFFEGRNESDISPLPERHLAAGKVENSSYTKKKTEKNTKKNLKASSIIPTKKQDTPASHDLIISETFQPPEEIDLDKL